MLMECTRWGFVGSPALGEDRGGWVSESGPGVHRAFRDKDDTSPDRWPLHHGRGPPR